MGAGLRQERCGFTLIELLVVVAILSTLVAVLLPSMSVAREQSKRTMCMSHEKLVGNGMALYAGESRDRLPWVGEMTDELINPRKWIIPRYYDKGKVDKRVPELCNLGVLYGKYCGKDLSIFFCPSDKLSLLTNPTMGIQAFVRLLSKTAPTSDNPPRIYQGYDYAVLGAQGAFPRNDSRGCYPEEMIKDFRGQKIPVFYREDRLLFAYLPGADKPVNAWSWLTERRVKVPGFGKRNVHALVSDRYAGGYGWYFGHAKGYNVLFSDYHARWINDANRKIVHGEWWQADDKKRFDAWDEFSRRP